MLLGLLWTTLACCSTLLQKNSNLLAYFNQI